MSKKLRMAMLEKERAVVRTLSSERKPMLKEESEGVVEVVRVLLL
jgi:hypothetical protein